MTEERKRNVRTKTTAIPMDTNVLIDTTVHIACTLKKDTRPVPQRRTQWVVVCYTNGCIQHIVWSVPADGVGREKGLVKEV